MAPMSQEAMIELLQSVVEKQSAQIQDQNETIAELRELVTQLRGTIANLEETVREFQRKLFGRSYVNGVVPRVKKPSKIFPKTYNSSLSLSTASPSSPHFPLHSHPQILHLPHRGRTPRHFSYHNFTKLFQLHSYETSHSMFQKSENIYLNSAITNIK